MTTELKNLIYTTSVFGLITVGSIFSYDGSTIESRIKSRETAFGQTAYQQQDQQQKPSTTTIPQSGTNSEDINMQQKGRSGTGNAKDSTHTKSRRDSLYHTPAKGLGQGKESKDSIPK